jgi:PAS domain S-box-containing protein
MQNTETLCVVCMRSLGPAETTDVSLRQILDGSLAFIGLINLDGTLLEANALALTTGGLRREDVIGKKFWDCYWWNYDPAIQAQLQFAHQRAVSGEVVRYDVRVRMAQGALMWIDFQMAPMRDVNGHVTHVIPSGLDLTARKRSEAALQNSEAKFRGIFENAFVGVALVGLDGTWLQVNERMCELLGYERDELVTRKFQDITHPDDLQGDLQLISELMAGRIKNYKMDKRYIRKDGGIIWASLTVALQNGADGAPLHFISIVSDISDRIAAQQHQRLLMSELAHRLKNQLAIVNAIASQSIRGSTNISEFRDKFGGRINALATSINLLVSEKRGNVSLKDLVEQTLSPFEGRRTISGGNVEISDQAPETLALAVHELATNATKYGAWSLPDGSVNVEWGLAESDDGRQSLKLSWVEMGGPPVVVPTRSGFGMTIIRSLAAQRLGAVVRYEYPTEGVRWHLEMPLERPVE